MPCAILDVDLAGHLEDAIGLDSYTQAFVLLRYHGRPVGHFWTRVRNGRVSAREVSREGLAAALPALSRQWIERQLRWSRGGPQTLPSATIAICTRERPDDLARCLRAVTRLARRDHPIIVIDNDPSTDRTAQLVGAYSHVGYVRESTRGVNAARNRALREANTDVVAFTDDDAVPEPGWLDALQGGFDHRLTAGVTGLTLPLELETAAQEWFERVSPFSGGYLRHEFDDSHSRPHVAGHVGAGANMAIRRDALFDVGGFDERLDAGTPTRSGGDRELFARLVARGYRLVYEPAAVSRHRHPRTWLELRETITGYGRGVSALWTGRLLERGELAVLKQAASWFIAGAMPRLAKALAQRPGAMPRDLVTAELVGCLEGPFAWIASARARRARRTA
jgi:cellulose synthase/poly-beta-1,6-N-acetylglucosamine synthase-like glycosyltransferase